MLSVHGVKLGRRVHRLVAEAFLGPRPPDHEVNHIDGDKKNNRAENLEYTSPGGNKAHAVAYGLTRRKLSLVDVRAIRAARANGVSGKSLAAKYGVSQASICTVYRGRRRPCAT